MPHNGVVTPSIGVAVTTFNQAKYIRQTLQSVFNQSRAPVEVVVVDDGSTDDTPAVLAEFRGCARVIHQRNAGVAGARNAAVLACTADYVALLDGDDVWLPSKLQHCADLLERFGPIGLLAHDVEGIAPDNSVVCRGLIAEHLRDRACGDVAVLPCLDDLIERAFIWTTSQVVVRRSDYLDVGLSNASFRIGSDWDLYLRLAARGPLLFSGEVLTLWRQHDASASGRSGRRELNWAVETARVLRQVRGRPEMAAHIGAINRRRRTLVREVYHYQQRCGRWATARALAQIAWMCRSPYGALAVGAVLAPDSVRRATASVTGKGFSTISER